MQIYTFLDTSNLNVMPYATISAYPSSIETFIIPLIKSQTVSNFTIAMSIDRIHYQITSSQINFFIRQFSHSLSSQTISITSPDGKFILKISIRHLLVSPYFVGIYTKAFTSNLNTTIKNTSPITKSFFYSTPVNTLTGGLFKVFFTGYYLNLTTGHYGISLQSGTISPTLFTVIFKNTVPVDIYLYSVEFFIVACTSSNVNYDGLKITVYLSLDQNISNLVSPYIYSNVNIQTDFVFYGFNVQRATFSALPYYLQYSSTPTTGNIEFSTTLALKDILLQYLVFGVSNVSANSIIPINCPKQYPYLDTIYKQCYDICPKQMISAPPQCFNCSLYCATCSSSTVCATCDASAYKISSKCTLVNNCASIQSNITYSVCLSCIAKYYPSLNATNSTVVDACMPCVFKCSTCTSISTCTLCQTGTLVANGCTNVANCNSVELDPTRSPCLSCKSKYYPVYDLTNSTIVNTCMPCVLNCLTCTSISDCSVCIPGYQIVGFSCTNVNNCSSAWSNTTYSGCLSCFGGYYPSLNLFNTSKVDICLPCVYKCNSCTTNNNCSSCVSGWFMVNLLCTNVTHCGSVQANVTHSKCLNCLSSYFPEYNTLTFKIEQCYKCFYYCLHCTSNASCINCQGNTFNTNNGCTLIQNCQYVNASITYSYCSQCKLGYFPIYNLNDQFIVEACSQCTEGCQRCSDTTNCFKCFSGFYLAADGCSPIPNCHRVFATNNITMCLQCIAFYYQIYNSVNSSKVDTCKPCEKDCKRCQNKTVCIECSEGFKVEGGCSTVEGCLSVYYYFQKSRCYKCDASQNMILDQNYKCVCRSGYWPLNGVCINIYGCLAARRINNENICLGCNLVKKIIYNSSSHNCECIPGTVFIDSEQGCVDVCGDGRSIFLECDDGNNKNQDGCSADCKRESGWNCHTSSPLVASKCIKNNMDIKIKLKEAWKKDGENRGEFIFQVITDFIIPEQLFIDLVFSTNKSAKLQSWSFKNQQISMNIVYNQTIESFPGVIQLMFNNSYTSIYSIKNNFNMDSNEENLIVYQEEEKIIKIKQIIYILSWVILVLFFLSNLLHKMIGVQTINTFQLVAIVTYFSHEQSPTIKAIRTLQITNFNFYYLFNNKSCFYFQKNIALYDFYNIQYSAVVIIGFLLVSLAYYYGKKIYKQYNEDNKKKIKLNKQKSIYKYYNKVVYPLLIGFIYITVFAILGQNIQTQLILEFKTLLVFMIVKILYFFVTIGEILNLCDKKQQPFGLKQVHEQYMPAYNIFVFIQMSLLMLGSFQFIPYVIEGFAISNFIFFIWFLIKSPYQKIIHNIGQGLNLMFLSLLSLWIVTRNNFKILSSQFYQLIILYVFCGFCAIITMIMVVRLLVQLYNVQKIQKTEKQKQLIPKYIKKQKKKKIKQQNKKQIQEFKSNINKNNFDDILNKKNNLFIQHKRKMKQLRDLSKLDFLSRIEILQKQK